SCSGIPANGSSEVIFASSSAELSMRSSPAREKSLECVLAERLPKNTRMPMAFDPDSFRVSTWPRRTRVENSSPSRMTHSAALAPCCIARRTMSWARDFRSVSVWGSRVVSGIRKTSLVVRPWLLAKHESIHHRGTETQRKTKEKRKLKNQLVAGPMFSSNSADLFCAFVPRCLCGELTLLLHEAAGIFACGAANRQPIQFGCGHTDPNRHGLAVFAAGSDAFIQLQIVAHHRNA